MKTCDKTGSWPEFLSQAKGLEQFPVIAMDILDGAVKLRTMIRDPPGKPEFLL
jgi:hypothetical protein